jgi:hypothetical protein
MATTYYNDIQKLYVAYFNRPADPAGLAYWETVVEGAKGSTAAVSASFAASAEYKAAYANMTNTQIVTAVYQNLFGHAPDAAGLKYWADLLDAKTTTIDAVVTNIAGGAQTTDLIAYTAKVTAASAFTAALDTDAEKAGYTGDAANKIGKTFLAGVTDSISLASATSPATLNGTVASAVAAGTTFSIPGALAQVSTATKALNDFVKATATTGTKDATQIETTQKAAVEKVAVDLGYDDTPADSTDAGNLFVNTTSQAVRDALVASQQATNASALSDAQKDVADDNAAIAKISGMSNAVAALTAAQTALKSATAADVSAQADLAAKTAAFAVNNKGATTGTLSVSGTDLLFKLAAGGTVAIGTVNADGTVKVSTAADFKASDYTGLTELIASYNADVATSNNVAKATDNANYAQLAVSLLDVATDGTATTTIVNDTYKGTYTDAQLSAKIADVINTTAKGTVAKDAVPTLSQIQTELAVLKAAANATTPAAGAKAAYDDFKALLDEASVKSGGATLDAKFNPLLSQLATDTKTLSDVNDAISGLAKDVAALQTATANLNTLNGLTATVNAYNQVLIDKGYAVTTLDANHMNNFASASSDVYVVSNKDASIAAFGLQGSDSLFVGTGYTLVQGAIGATGVKGNDSAMEIFVSKTAGGDAQLQIETHAYSSAVTGGTGEVITITLTGVDASTIKLDSTGIITAGTAAA